VIHCDTSQQAEEILRAIRERLHEVKLKLNEKKTQTVYCKDYRRTQKHEKVQFGFLGFSYQPRKSKSQVNNPAAKSFTAFTAEISKENQQKIRDEISQTIQWRNTEMEITDIAAKLNIKLRGWINYFGLFGKTALRRTMMTLDYRLMKWLQAKYKINGTRKAIVKLAIIRKQNPRLFYHWEKGYSYVIKK
jgi:hypothetical protein